MAYEGVVDGRTDSILTSRDVDILTSSATDIAKRISERDFSAKEVVQAFIKRIQAVNPAINAIVADNFEQAVEEAVAIDTLVQGGQTSAEELLKEKPLLGVPITVKECISVRGMPYTAGLVKRAGTVAEEDAPIVRNLRDAGAIPIGVTNTSELCRWFESANRLYGLTRNPYNLDHTAGGSSGGEGAIVASAGSVIGIASDGGGSARFPAFCNGLFSHKATWCLLSNEKMWPLGQGPASTMVVVAPLCRYSVDLSLTIDIMAGKLPSDSSSFSKRVQEVDVASLKVVSIPDDGGCSSTKPVCREIRDIQTQIEHHLRSKLNAVVEVTSEPRLGQVYDLYMALAAEDTGPSICELLANEQGSIGPFWELGKWVFGRSNLTFPSILQGMMEKVFRTPQIGEDNAEAHRQRDELKHRLEVILGEKGVLLYPTRPTPACEHNRSWFHLNDFTYTCVFSFLGFPVTTVPLGSSSKGLPLGIQIVSTEGNDHLTIAVAMAIERTMKECSWNCPPLFPFSSTQEDVEYS